MSSLQPVVRSRMINHVTIVADDLDRTRDFYTRILGMTEISRPDFGFPGLWLDAGGTQVHVNIAGENTGRAGLPDMGACSPSQGFHVAFEVEDVGAAASALAQSGFELIDGPRARPDGVWQFYIRDPDGHLIEICGRSS